MPSVVVSPFQVGIDASNQPFCGFIWICFIHLIELSHFVRQLCRVLELIYELVVSQSLPAFFYMLVLHRAPEVFPGIAELLNVIAA